MFWKDGEEIYLDEKLDYGDLVFLDQASYYHEVKKIKVTDKQIGRLQFYVPTIPYGYMKDCYKFQDYPFKYYFSKRVNFIKKIYLIFRHYLKEKQIHYSRMNFFKNYK